MKRKRPHQGRNVNGKISLQTFRKGLRLLAHSKAESPEQVA